MAKKYIPANCWLTCDKGQKPTQITVTHDNNTCIYGERLVSEADMLPGENVQPFGSCSILKGSCCFTPVYWDKCNQNVKVNGFKLVFEDAHLICKHGGKIKVDFTVPSEASIALGLGMLHSVNQFSLMAPVLEGVQTIMPLDQIRWSQATVSSTFKDGRSLSATRDAILRSGNAYGKIPPLEVVHMPDGGITSLDHRRAAAALDAGAKKAPVIIREGNASLPPDQVERFKVDKMSGGKRIGLSEGARASTYEEAINIRSVNQGKKFPIEGSKTPPRVTGGGIAAPSKASQAIGKVSQSISNTKFSQAVQANPNVIASNAFLARNAGKISTTGKVVGRGLIVVGIAAESYNVYTTYEAEGEFGAETKQATGGAVGSIAGGLAGAKGGAMLFGAIGTAICPGIGTAIGGVVGGVLGGIGGAIAGSSLGQSIASWF